MNGNLQFIKRIQRYCQWWQKPSARSPWTFRICSIKISQRCKSLLIALDDVSNSFEGNSSNIFGIETKIEVIPQNLYKLESIGDKQFQEFLEKRLWERSTPLSDTISKNKLFLLTTDEQLNSAKCNVLLFSMLFIYYNMQNEWQGSRKVLPTWKSAKSTIVFRKRGATTSQIKIWFDCLLSKRDITSCESPPVDCKTFDGPALVIMLSLESNCRSFLQYSKEVFIPYLKSRTILVQRVDLAFDMHFKDSLKSRTHSNHRIGLRRKVTEEEILPNNWRTFLWCSENKKQLFPFLS